MALELERRFPESGLATPGSVARRSGDQGGALSPVSSLCAHASRAFPLPAMGCAPQAAA